jgi:hypothetical protein
MLLPVFVCWLLQPILISPIRSKTAPAAGQRLEPSFHRMRYGGLATPGRSYQVCLAAFVPSGVLLIRMPDR